jgi:hypothetical protein
VYEPFIGNSGDPLGNLALSGRSIMLKGIFEEQDAKVATSFSYCMTLSNKRPVSGGKGPLGSTKQQGSWPSA